MQRDLEALVNLVGGRRPRLPQPVDFKAIISEKKWSFVKD